MDNRDWRTHLEQMHTYRGGIEEALVTTRVHLDKLHGDISKTLEKISSRYRSYLSRSSQQKEPLPYLAPFFREKYLNSQLEGPLAELRSLSDSLAAAKEQYRYGIKGRPFVVSLPELSSLFSGECLVA